MEGPSEGGATKTDRQKRTVQKSEEKKGNPETLDEKNDVDALAID